MYLLWSRGYDDITFPMIISTNASAKRAKRAAHGHSHVQMDSQAASDGMLMAQLLRADKLEIPEKLSSISFLLASVEYNRCMTFK